MAVVLIGMAGSNGFASGRASGKGERKMTDQTTADVGGQFVSDLLDEALKWSFRGQKLWSLANHGSTICIVVFSAVAAVLSQTDSTSFIDPNTGATILSLFVTILSTVQSKLGFERKWIANRMTQNALRQLLIDEKTGVGLKDVKERLKTILDQHNKAITAAASA
jgi:Protein of unknown function (DUF4231)